MPRLHPCQFPQGGVVTGPASEEHPSDIPAVDTEAAAVEVASQTGEFDVDDIYDVYQAANALKIDTLMSHICETARAKVALNLEVVHDFERLLDQAIRLMEEYGHRKKVSAAFLGIIYEVAFIHEWYTVYHCASPKTNEEAEKLAKLDVLATKYGLCPIGADCVGCLKRRMRARRTKEPTMVEKVERLCEMAWENTWGGLGRSKMYDPHPPDPRDFD
ncbi:hypothetical protein H072_6656 [Dactylellina haptotyla CBS 200.50]|uniref:Uncharacterized protein n=1 Tax=Dactylellina haptotyla (strain CBS 200.50) TaxID=1284197 RepID=S8BW92_DACHA|nr:hypothetical protein H072_6656 [Dactylellina haptotyla CBS 200.50]